MEKRLDSESESQMDETYKPEKEGSTNENKPKETNPTDLKDLYEYYDMSDEKRLIILNHYKYDETSHFFEGMSLDKRHGTDKDVEILEKTFKELGFNIDTYHDPTYLNIYKIFNELRPQDLNKFSCICVAILTHGSYRGELLAKDRSYNLKHILEFFEGHPYFAGKPKIFLIQACRGNAKDRGVRMDSFGRGANIVVTPTHSDFLIVRSTVEDFVSYRDTKNGSWLIQKLCRAIQRYHKHHDILHIMTLVQQEIAHGCRAKTNRLDNFTVQMPETTFTLTKMLKFTS